MNNSKEKISSLAMMLTIGCFVQSSSLFYGYVSGIVSHDTWITVITAFIVSFPILYMFAVLFEKFPGKNIIEINNIVFGKIIGKIISILDVFYFFSLCFMNGSLTGDFVTDSVLHETPKSIVIIFFIFFCSYAVLKGIEPITRLSTVFFVITISALLSAIFLLLKDVDFNNLFPMLDLPITKYLQATHQIAAYPFCDLIVFTMVFPNLRNPDKIKKPLLGGFIMGAITMLGIVGIDTLVLGPAQELVIIPSYDVIRLVNIGNILTRLDFVFSLVFFMLFFFKVSILIYVTVKSFTQLFNIKSYRIFVPIIGTAIVSFSLIAYDTPMESTAFISDYLPWYQTFFELVLPLLTLIIVLIKKLGNKKSEAIPKNISVEREGITNE